MKQVKTRGKHCVMWMPKNETSENKIEDGN